MERQARIARHLAIFPGIALALPMLLCAQTPQDTVGNPSVHIMKPMNSGSTTQLSTGTGLAKAASVSSIPDFPEGHGIGYNGGAVMLGTVNVYYVWYGNWSGNSAVSILSDLINNISGSPYFHITSSYYDGNLNRLANSVRLAGSYFDNYSLGASNPDPGAIVAHAIVNANALPFDPNGVYFVLTSPDVRIQGFLSQFCGYHTYGSISSYPGNLKVAFVGDANNNPGCAVQTTNSPNNNPPADAMASVIAHELAEMITDPTFAAWYRSNSDEMADVCSWTFGTQFAAPNGSRYNVTLGGRNYLLQQLFANDSDGYCTMAWPTSVPSDQWFNIVSKESGLCVDMPTYSGDNNGQQPGTQLQEWYCWDGPMQKFRFTPAAGGYEITVQNSGQQFDVAGGPSAIYDGAPVIQWPFWGGSNEIWEVSDVGSDGYLTISAFSSGRTLDAESVPQTNFANLAGTPLQQWNYWAAANQRWKLVPAQ
ncbi:MAG: RICIN domain-containing protein [Acidobacteriaceae bacterium]|nr:RICIN domain-containing protein [Acidobacteriaceae bacterium]